MERRIFNKWLGCGRGSSVEEGGFLCVQPMGAQLWGIQSSQDDPLQGNLGCWLGSSGSLYIHTWFCCVLHATHEHLLCFQRKRHFPSAETKSMNDKTRQKEQILKHPVHSHTCWSH